MIGTLGLLAACALVIYFACEYFVNGVEWLGARLDVARSAIGSVLAAFGTALPESVVTFVAVVSGRSPAERGMGVGAALGGPLVLATVAYGVVGLTWVLSRQPREAWLSTELQGRLARDQVWFLVVFVAKVALGAVAFALKPWLALLFLAVYAAYTWRELRAGHGGGSERELEPLMIRPATPGPHLGWILLQTGMALGVTFVASEYFVRALGEVSPWLGLTPQTAALLLSPLATELPETLNAVIWIRQGKTTLALGNISGAMMIQATVPSAIGIWYTPWLFDRALYVAAGVTALSVALMAYWLRRAALTPQRLAAFAAGYAVFVLLLMA